MCYFYEVQLFYAVFLYYPLKSPNILCIEKYSHPQSSFRDEYAVKSDVQRIKHQLPFDIKQVLSPYMYVFPL